jgi:hypothetical protein
MTDSPRPTKAHQAPPPTAVICCSVLQREVEHFARDMRHIVHTTTHEYGLHHEPDKLNRTLQQTIEQVDQTTDAEVIVLAYGLCSRGTEGLRTRRCRLVIPRAHDCITLLLGSKERYAEYVADHPGTYWYSPGWNAEHLPPGKARYDHYYQQYLEKYGEDNAQYLMEMEQQWMTTYDRATYVDLGIGATDDDVTYTRQCADWLGWEFDQQHGDPALMTALLTGPWDDERFVILEPGQTMKLSGDSRVMDKTD